MIKYISDIHFDHQDVCSFESYYANGNYPYWDIFDHDEDMIHKWNACVTESDDVYIVGDFSFGTEQQIIDKMTRLTGNKHLILGNHDDPSIYQRIMKNRPECKLVSMDKMLTINDGKQQVFLCHYPVLAWPNQHHGTIHVYGHVHNTIEEDFMQLAGKHWEKIWQQNEESFKAYNAAACLNHFRPSTLEQLQRNSETYKRV